MVMHFPNIEVPLITYLLSPILRPVSAKNDPRSAFAIPTPPWCLISLFKKLTCLIQDGLSYILASLLILILQLGIHLIICLKRLLI